MKQLASCSILVCIKVSRLLGCVAMMESRIKMQDDEALALDFAGFDEAQGIYSTLIAATPDGIVVTNLCGRIFFVSPTALKAFRCKSTDMVGRSFFDWIDPAERIKADMSLRYIVAEGRPRQTEFTLQRSDATAFTGELNAAVIKSPQGIPIGVIYIVRDVTERKKMQSALAEEAMRRHIFTEQSKDGVAILDAQGKLREFNPSFARMLGYETSEMQELHVWDWEAQWAKEELMGRLADLQAKSATFETRHRRKNGSIYDVEISVSKAVFENQTQFYCVCRDVSGRKANERNIRERQAKLDGILRTAPIGIAVLVDRTLVEVNTSFCRMLGYSAGELIGSNSRHFYASQKDYEHVGQNAYRDLDECNLRTVETQWLTKQGQVIDILASASAIDPRDLSQGVVFTALDVTARHRAEKEVEQLHKDLLLASRQAGMAEVATSVLHNVGNVLNSINVSISVILEKLKSSKTGNVEQIGSLMTLHATDLAQFIATDPTGKELPAYVNRLAGKLKDEQAFLVKEAESLRDNIGHIKEIVSMQQSYAKGYGVVERLNPKDLMEDALQMNRGALIRHDVQVVREFSANLPEILVEKHKVLQILVNLIRNAKYACDESGRLDKRVTLRLSQEAERIVLVVADNGVGIPAQNMGRIFKHGFTTRKNGHGFGLHSSALAATELGGKLYARSEGHLRGAAFTLELPLQPPRPHG